MGSDPSHLITALVLLVAYLFGGYVAGRMARRSGLMHGVAVFVLSIVAGAVAGAIVGGLSDSSDVERNLRSIGVPTSGDEWSGVSVVAAIVAIAAILVGAILGGKLGERWHSKLARRAADPSIGPAADARRQAQEADEQREQRLERDELVAREAARRDRNDADPSDRYDRPDDTRQTVASDGESRGSHSASS
jgi:hypothetical protein